jgi:hypothetical protein
MQLPSQNYRAVISESSFPRRRESSLDYFAWIPARAALGRDDAVRAYLVLVTRHLEGM